MSVHVHFRSGKNVHFLVPRSTTVAQFKQWTDAVDPSGIKTYVIVL